MVLATIKKPKTKAGGFILPEELEDLLKPPPERVFDWGEYGQLITATQARQLGYPGIREGEDYTLKLLKGAEPNFYLQGVPKPPGVVPSLPPVIAPSISPRGEVAEMLGKAKRYDITPSPLPEPELPELIGRVYPEFSAYDETANVSDKVTALKEWAFEEPEIFLNDLRTKASDEDAGGILRIFGATEQDISEILGVKIEDRRLWGAAERLKAKEDEDLRRLREGGVPEAEIEKIVAQQKGMPAGIMPPSDWLDKVGEIINNPVKLVPFVSSGVEIFTIGRLLKTALDLEANREVGKEDLLALKEYVDRSQRDTTWGYKVADVLANLVPFAGEFLTTGGIYSLGSRTAMKAGTEALKRIATKTGAKILEKALVKYGVNVVGTIGGGTLRTIPIGLARVPASTLEKQLQHTLIGDEEAIWKSAVKSMGEQWVEVVSESTGGLFKPLLAPIKGQLVKLAIFKAFQKANPGKSANDVRRVVESLGYHGVLEEMLEERVADVGHGILWSLGLGDQKFSIPSKEQLSIEVVSFSIPGVAFKVSEEMTRLKGVLVGERGAIEIPGEKPEVKPEVIPAKPAEVAPIPTKEAVVTAEKVIPKEPWQITVQEQFSKWREAQPVKFRPPEGAKPAPEFLLAHRQEVEQAIKAGKAVPAEVLKDYPDLAEKVKVTPAPEVTIPKSIDEITYKGTTATGKKIELTPEMIKTEIIDDKFIADYISGKTEWGAKYFNTLEEANLYAQKVADKFNLKTFLIETEPIIPKAEVIREAIGNLKIGDTFTGKVGTGFPETDIWEKVAESPRKGVTIRNITTGETRDLNAVQGVTPSVAIPKVEAGMPEAVFTVELRTLAEKYKTYRGFLKASPFQQIRMKEGIRIYEISSSSALWQENPEVRGLEFTEQQLQDFYNQATGIKGVLIPEVPAVAEAVEEVAPPLLTIPEETTLPMPDEVNVSEDRVVRPPPPPKEPPPSEPSLTHAPQPAPIEEGRLVMPDLQAPQLVVDMYSKPDFWRRIGNLPLVRKAVGLFDPWAIANKPADQAVALRATLKDEAAQKAQAVMSHVWEIGTQDRVWGKTDEMGLLTKEPFTGISLDDIRTNPSKFSAQMTDKQKEWIKRAEEVEKAKLDALKRNDIEINELSFEDGGQYAGRRVMGKFNDAGELIESGRIGIGGRVGAKMPFEKTRIFKTASDGISAGYRYMNSDEALYYNTLGAYYKIADKQMAEWVLTKVDWRDTKAPEALVLQAEASRLRYRKAQQLLAALNRAVRGERVPSNTINSIASVYADQADTLKNLIPELQKPSPETADIVRILDKEAKALISEARLEYAQAVDKRARAREEAMRVKYEEASIAHPAFQGKIFTGAEAKKTADILRKGLQPQFIEALGAGNKVNAIGRFFMLAGDASPMAIQLQFLAFYRPVAYAKSWGGFVRAMFDPEFQYRQYANNRDLINKHPTLILSGRGTEFTEFMGRGGLGKKLGVLAKPLVPFQQAFEGCLDTAGIELAKSLDHLCTTPERTLEVDQFINEFRGITSSARIGVGSIQRQVETGILLAPRYNRAIAGYLFDIVHGGLRGQQARMSLAQGFAGMAAMAVAISIALGEDEDEIWEHFNPESPKFYTWDVMGVKIGLGGKVRSVIKLFGNMTRTGEIGQPALNFLRGNLSPGASTGLDLLTGKNYIGEPTRDNVLDFTKTVGRNFMMIWTQSFLMEGGTLKDKAIIATAEFLGLRGYDISAKKELKLKDLEELLGQQIGKTPVLTKKKPDIFDMRNFYSDAKRILQYISPEDVLADKGYSPLAHAVIKIEQSEGKKLPNIRFQDYNFDPTKGDIVSDYMRQWAERQRITEAGERATYIRVKIVEGKEERTTFKGLAALNAHKVDYPKAQLGNLTRRQRELLLEYNAATDKNQFVKDNPNITLNPQDEWLKKNPQQNAEWALFGQAPILAREAYNHFKELLVEWDIPNAGIPEMILPPETSIEAHFKYEEMVTQGKHGSWEAQLLLLKDAEKNNLKLTGIKSYAEWHELTLSDTPIASLELRVDNRDKFDLLKNFGNEDSLEFKDDTNKTRDKATGLTDRDRATLELRRTKVDGVEFRDIERRVDAIEKGTNEEPTSEAVILNHIEYMRIQDEPERGSSSAEAMLFRVDMSDYNDWRMDKTIWGEKEGDTLKPVDETKIPGWRIDVKYRKEDDWYNKGIVGKHNKITYANETLRDNAIRAERAQYRIDNVNWSQDSRRREAYGLTNPLTGEKFPADQVEAYVGYMETIDKPGIGSSSAEAMLYRVDNPGFDKALIDIKDAQPVDITKIPSWRIDVKWRTKDTEYEAIKDPDDIKQTRLRDEYLTRPENEEYRKDRRRRDAYALTNLTGDKFPDDQIENYVAYYELPGKGFRRERLLIDAEGNPTPLGQAMHNISGMDLPKPQDVPSVGWDETYEANKTDFDKFWGLADSKSINYIEDEDERKIARGAMRYDAQGSPTDFFRAEKRLEAYEEKSPTGVRLSEENVNKYVSYYELSVKGFRQERFLIDNPEFAGAMRNVGKIIDLPYPLSRSGNKVPAVQYDDIYDQYSDQFDEVEGNANPDSKYFQPDKAKREARDKELRFNPTGTYTEFGLAELRHNAYGVFVPAQYSNPKATTNPVDDYVGYYKIIGEGKPKLRAGEKDAGWYENDWFMMEHPEFYKEVYLGILKNERKDYRLVPTREVFAKYQIYLNDLVTGKPREDYRWDNPDLEDWLLLTGKVTQSVKEKKRRAELIPAEKLAEEVAERIKRIRELGEPLKTK